MATGCCPPAETSPSRSGLASDAVGKAYVLHATSCDMLILVHLRNPACCFLQAVFPCSFPQKSWEERKDCVHQLHTLDEHAFMALLQQCCASGGPSVSLGPSSDSLHTFAFIHSLHTCLPPGSGIDNLGGPLMRSSFGRQHTYGAMYGCSCSRVQPAEAVKHQQLLRTQKHQWFLGNARFSHLM